MKKKKVKIGELSLHEILVKQRVSFRKPTKVESGKKKVRREKDKIKKFELEDYCA